MIKIMNFPLLKILNMLKWTLNYGTQILYGSQIITVLNMQRSVSSHFKNLLKIFMGPLQILTQQTRV